jgi:hypothetical protein
MGKAKNTYTILFRNLKGRDYFGDRSIGWKIILKWMLRK